MFGAEFQSGSLWYFIYSVHAVLMGCTHLLFWSTCSHLFRPQPVWFIALISLQLLFASFLQLRLKCNLHLPFPTLSSEDSEAMARQPVLSHKHLQPSRISFNEALYMHSLINRKQREEGSREEGKKSNRRTISNVCVCVGSRAPACFRWWSVDFLKLQGDCVLFWTVVLGFDQASLLPESSVNFKFQLRSSYEALMLLLHFLSPNPCS